MTFTARATRAQLLGTNPSNAKVIDSFMINKPYPGGENPCAPVPPPDPGPEPVPDAPGDAGAPIPDLSGSADAGPVPPETIFIEPTPDSGAPASDSWPASDTTGPSRPDAVSGVDAPPDDGDRSPTTGKSGGGCRAGFPAPAGWWLAGLFLWPCLRRRG